MKFKLVEDVEKQELNELLSESDFKDPIRIAIKVKTVDNSITNENIYNATLSTISSMSLKPELLMGSLDGNYQICFPGRKDWIKLLSDTLQLKLKGKAIIEITGV